VKKSIIISLSLILLGNQARGHDQWANGTTVPSWVKAACCGPDDVHHLRPDQVHGPTLGADGELYYQVDGYDQPVLASTALPSQDGDYWIFYRDGVYDSGVKYQSGVYCFFVPMNF
jgi:hypothetical protein